MAFTQLPTGGVPNVDLITSTLAKLQPDSALQQYAMMHKNDPYIVSLATAESNRRKALRTAAQGQVGQQPTVVDQDIAGMAPAPVASGYGGQWQTEHGGHVMTGLPEDQGIARLPTPNIRSMADGGIAGFDESSNAPITTKRLDNMGKTDGMFNYAQDGGGVMRMAGGGHVPRYQGNTMDGSVVGGIPGFQAVQPRAEFTQAGSPENQTPWERFTDYMGDKKKQALLAEIAARINQGIARPEEIALYNSERIKAGDKAATEAKYPSNMATRAKDFPGVKAGYENVSAAAPSDKAPPPPAPNAAPAPQAALPTGIATIKAPTAAEATKASDQFFDADALTRRLDQQRLQERQDIGSQKEARIAQLDEFSKKQGPAYAGYEKLLQKEELQDTTDKEKSGLMSLMKGFLAMAAGESPNAATNIAKGAMVGLGDYGDALKEFKKAAKERNKAMADIENARRAESRDDLKSQQAYEEKADTRMAESDRAFTSAVTQITGKKGEIASGIFKDMVNNAEATNRVRIQEAGHNARTNAQLAAPSGVEKLVGRMQTDPGFAAAYRDYASIGPELKGDQAILAKYAGPQGEIALKMLENSGPEGKLQAQLIRQKLSAAMLMPTNKPSGQVLVGQ